MTELLPNIHFQKALSVAEISRPELVADQTGQMFDSRLTNEEINLRFWGRYPSYLDFMTFSLT